MPRKIPSKIVLCPNGHAIVTSNNRSVS